MDTPTGGGRTAALVPPRGTMALRRRDLAWSVLGALVTAAGGFGFAWLVARELGPSGSGAVLSLAAWFLTFSIIGKLGLDTALVWSVARWTSGAHDSGPGFLLRWALLPAFGFSLVLAVIGWVAAPDIARTAFDSGFAQGSAVIRAATVALPLSVVTMLLLAAIRGAGNARPLMAIDQVLKPAVRLLLALALILGGATSDSLAGAWLAAVPVCLLAAMLATAQARRAMSADAGGNRGSGRERVGLWRFAAPRWAAQGIDVVGVSIGVLVLSLVGTPAQTGLFATALRVVLVGQLALSAFRMLIAPMLAFDIARGDLAAAQRIYSSATVLVVGVSFPLYLGMLVRPDLAMAVFGTQFTQAATVLVVLGIGAAVQAAMGNLQAAVLMSGRSSHALLATAAALVVNALLIVATFPVLGLLSAGVGWSMGIVVEALMLAWFAHRHLALRPLGRGTVQMMALTCAVWVPTWWAVGWLLERSPPAAVLAAGTGLVIFLALARRPGLRAWVDLSTRRSRTTEDNS